MKIANKFDRKAQQLKARVQFVRGTVRKPKGRKLTDDEVETMTDQSISDEIDLGNLEVVERSDEVEADDAQDDGKPGKAA